MRSCLSPFRFGRSSARDSQSVELCRSARHDCYFLLKQDGAPRIAEFNVVVAWPEIEFPELPGDAKVPAININAGIFIIRVELQLTRCRGCNNHPRGRVPGSRIPVAVA